MRLREQREIRHLLAAPADIHERVVGLEVTQPPAIATRGDADSPGHQHVPGGADTQRKF